MAESISPEQIQAMIVRQAQAWEEQNVQAIVNDFAEEAMFIAAGFKFTGKQQIKQAAQDYFKQFYHTSVKIKRTIVDGDLGAVEWDWRDQNRKTGKESLAEDAIVFELANGKILYWREYIEKKK
ncbi:MAG: nuclear transport factor 2 family protein [Pleurocapsa sp. SU_5_0]|nr:nuclear transport factor 2 family protein [Pleurocapsa sp. SU_5_0]NJO97500.1 nuclear transport factor 2 family protein [Pleurocapsa sp. CRU_1_2]NJR47226.1 nuclear transport factor 2 family protein [Hyellaceae cyanobacterium CSU_1_1]